MTHLAVPSSHPIRLNTGFGSRGGPRLCLSVSSVTECYHAGLYFELKVLYYLAWIQVVAVREHHYDAIQKIEQCQWFATMTVTELSTLRCVMVRAVID